ncbi:MAG: hypothetical protein J6Y72_09740 [Bacteroidales bacterium]|nr:hypothetical protein [Bacteroidales bacterium]
MTYTLGNWAHTPNEQSSEGKKSISLLLGAGFSAPMGYPIGSKLSDSLLHFDYNKFDVDSSGILKQSEIKWDNCYHRSFLFCQYLIKEYNNAHNQFDYEVFFDFIKSLEVKEDEYKQLYENVVSECTTKESYEDILYYTEHIYSQMVQYLLKDKYGVAYYENEPLINTSEHYYEFLHYLSRISRKYVVNVHTLNHDLLFESFNNASLISGEISDGFDEYGSEYYGNLNVYNSSYKCQLKRYTGQYDKQIRLLKLHGSIDYVPLYSLSESDDGNHDINYVKTRRDIDIYNIFKERKAKDGYNQNIPPYHTDCLTGQRAKIERYKEEFFNKLLSQFGNNLKHAEKLIIIGYGGRDDGINNIISKNFDVKDKKVVIVDTNPSNALQGLFQGSENVIYKRKSVSEIKSDEILNIN